MKLWYKIAIICATILIVTVSVTSFLVLREARESVLDLTVNDAKEYQSQLNLAFSNMLPFYLEQNPELSIDEAASKCFSVFADETCVLLQEDRLLYSFQTIRPERILPVSTMEQRLYIDEEGNRNLLIVGSLADAGPGDLPFQVYTVRDISPVYENYRILYGRALAVSIAAILLGTMLITATVRRVTNPLKQLSNAATRIADGEYDERVPVRTKDEIGQLSGDFNRMADAVEENIQILQEKNRNQELFIGGLTHEFKTPMTSLMLHSETLLTMKLNEEQQRRSLMHIRTQVQWLEKLTTKLLQLITIGQDIQKQRIQASVLLGRVAESTAETMEQRGTKLLIQEDGGSLILDPDLIQSLLINLVDNASKASEPGQEILLKQSRNCILVRDSGKGIPPEAISKITEPFFMVDKSRTKKYGGSGLGMALAKRIADAHEAQIQVESREGMGTTITVCFPENSWINAAEVSQLPQNDSVQP